MVVHLRAALISTLRNLTTDPRGSAWGSSEAVLGVVGVRTAEEMNSARSSPSRLNLGPKGGGLSNGRSGADMNDAEHEFLGGRATIHVKTIYGWGWVIDGEPRFKVPEPFAVRLDGSDEQVQSRTGQSDQRRPTGPRLGGRHLGRSWTGVVLTQGHEFDGRYVILAQRHREWTGHVHIEVQPADTDGKSSFGFGILASVPSSTD
jgi:hypothetical protein